MMYVGLTGGLGSGKTTIARIFQVLEVPVYFSDTRAKLLMSIDPTLKAAIRDEFGEEAYKTDGSLNRQFLASLVFSDKEKLATLNKIVHPAVRKDFEIWAQKQNCPYVITESAILIESGLYKLMHKVVSVFANEQTRVERVVRRDFLEHHQVWERINNQTDDENRSKHSDFIIDNNQTMLIGQVLKIHTKLWEISRNG